MRNLIVGIVEDNVALRESIEDYLMIKGHNTLFSSGKLVDILETNYEEAPDFILLDEHLEDLSGVESLRDLKKKFPYTDIVIITGDEKPQLILHALENGASGFLYKPFTVNQIESVFTEIFENGSYLHPVSATRLITSLKKDKEVGEKQLEKLSKKEMEIARLLMEGKSYKEIATAINKTFFTVNHHIRNMYVKFNVNSKAELIYKLNNNKTFKK